MEQEIASQVVGLGGSSDFSLWSLFLRADIVVKSVIVILIVCSIYSWALIFNKYKMFIYTLKGTLKENLHIINEYTMYIGGPRIDLSSTNIRKIVSKKSDPKDLISNKVMEYINSNKLYQ